MDDLISVVVPVYNVEKYLKDCVESIITQSYTKIQIILVDDGSTDKSGNICDQLLKQDNRIQVIHKKNEGLSIARNTGIEVAMGKYICFVDSDDLINKYFIEILYKACKENDCKMSMCNYFKFYNNDELKNIKNNKDKEIDLKIESRISLLEGIYINNHIRNIIAVNKLYLKELFSDIKYTENKLHEDEFTTYKLIYKCDKIAIVDTDLYYYRQSPNSIMRKQFNIKRLDYIEALEERMSFYKEKKEKKLYDMTLKTYCYTLLKMRNLCKKNITDSKKITKELKKKYRKSILRALRAKYIKIKSKIVIICMAIFPSSEKLLLERSNNDK